MSAAAPAIRPAPARRPVAVAGVSRGAGRARRAPAAPGFAAITWVKLTFSLAAVSATIPASAAARPAGPVRAASATPSSAPRALAPLSPSMIRSSQVGGQQRRRRRRPARRRARRSDRPPAARRPARRPSAPGPGRRSSRLSRFAVPAITPAPSSTSIRPRRRRQPGRRAGRRGSRQQRGGGEPGRADPGDLHQAAGDPALPQRRQVPRKPLAACCSGRAPTRSS